MKALLLVLILMYSSFVYSQSGVQFTTPITVAGGTTYGYIKPKVVVDAHGNPVVLWGKTSTHEIFVSTFNGSSFNTPVKINPVNTHPYIASFYNADIKSNGDTLVAVFATDMPSYRVYLVKSTDGGNSWSDTIRVDQIPTGGIAYFPSVDINEHGHVAVTFMKHEAGWANPRYVVSTSLDGGNTFLPDTNASAVATGEVCDCCPAEMMYEGDTQVLLFRNNDMNIREFYAAISNDNGASFQGLHVDNLGWTLAACPSVAPTGTIQNDSLISVFMSGASGANRLYISTASLTNMVTGNIMAIDDSVVSGTSQTQPQIAGNDEVMALVWANSYPGNADIYFRFSNTGASGLVGNGINISNPTTGSQQNPDIAYSHGVFHIVYQNTQTQQVFYLKALVDQYIGVEGNNEKLSYSIQQNNGLFYLTMLGDDENNSAYHIYDVYGKKIYQSKLESGKTEFDMSVYAHGFYWIKLEGYNKAIKFYW